MDKAAALEKLRRQVEQIDLVRRNRRFSPEFKKWRRDTEVVIEKVFGEETRHTKDFRDVGYSLGAFRSGTHESEFAQAFQQGLDVAKQILTSMVEEVQEYWDDQTAPPVSPTATAKLERLCDRFHLVARRLRSRHANRPALEVEDEYDVQDLLHALLTLEFDDVRVEEWTPSYAGGSARMDFLLKREGIVVEVKRTRSGLGAREVADQLLVDIGRYHAHPDCTTLFSFVYDPEGRIVNPRGFEVDLSKETNGVVVKILVRPKGL